MKPRHLNFVIFLYLATVPMCSGYKPLRGTQGNGTVSLSFDPDNPPPEHGKSVYDPDIYNKYAGIQFQDQIEDEETDEDTLPNMPSYPWRGGGHVPMPLDDPDALKAEKKVEYLIGFRDCKEILSPSVFKDDLDDDDEEKKETEVEADAKPLGEKCCKKKQYLDEDTEDVEVEEANIEVTDEEEEEKDEDQQETSESKTKCEGCAREASSFALRGVGAVSVLGRDYLLDNTLAAGVDNAAVDNFGGGDYSVDHYYPCSDGLYKDDQQAGSGGDVGILIGSMSSDLPGETGQDYRYRPVELLGDEKEDKEQTSQSEKKCEGCAGSQEASSFSLRGVEAVSVVGRDYLDQNTLTAGDNNTVGGGDHPNDLPEDHYFPYSADLYKDDPLAGGADVVTFLDGGTSSETGQCYLYPPYALPRDDKENNEQTSHSNKKCEDCADSREASSLSLRGVEAVSVVGRDYLDQNTLVAGDNAAGSGDQYDDQIDDHYYPYSDDLYKDEQHSGGGEGGGEGGGGPDVVAILDGGTSSGPDEASRGYLYRPDALPGDEDADEDGQMPRRLSVEGCRLCAPCCAFLAEHEEERLAHGGRRRRAGECTRDDSERDFMGAECRSCHVRRRPPHLGVVLTCYECATQQADRACRLGHENVEFSHYRVSAKFFLTTESNYTGEITATQHTDLLARQPGPLPAQQMSARASGMGHTPGTPSFIDSDSKDLYPFQDENAEDNAEEDALTGDEGEEEEEQAKEGEEEDKKKGNSKKKNKK